MVTIKCEVKSNVIPQVIAALLPLLYKIVRKAAFDIEARAKQKAPVDTGALRASIYTRTPEGSGYGDAAEAVNGLDATKDVGEEAPQPGDLEAYVGVGVNYGLYVEMGTAKQAAQPFLTPAVEEVRQPFVTAVKQALEKPL